MQDDEFALADDEEFSSGSSSVVNNVDISRELEQFRQQWYDEIRMQAEKSTDAAIRSKVHQLVHEPTDEDQVILPQGDGKYYVSPVGHGKLCAYRRHQYNI